MVCFGFVWIESEVFNIRWTNEFEHYLWCTQEDPT